MARAPLPQLRVVGSAFLRRRPLITLPIGLANLGLLAAGDAANGQLLRVAIGMVLLQAMFFAERAVGARTTLSEVALARSLAVTELVLGFGSALTGGVASPFVPLLLAPCGIAFAAFGSSRAGAAVFGELIAIVAALALLRENVPYVALGSPYREIAIAINCVGSAVLLWIGVGALVDAHAAAAAALDRAGEDAVQAASERSRVLDTVGARVAHEVKNPLAAIRGLVEVMIEARGGLSEDRDHRRLVVVAEEVARIERILHDYLGHHRPAADLELADVAIEQVMHDIVAVLEARADRARVALSAAGPAIVARVDPRRLKEAVLNLALNALEVTPQGGRIDLRWLRDAGAITITITDTGRGMTPAELAKVGTPGFTTRGDGTGLGVVLARGVIEQHGGRLELSSTLGRGTIATIALRSEPWPPS